MPKATPGALVRFPFNLVLLIIFGRLGGYRASIWNCKILEMERWLSGVEARNDTDLSRELPL